MSVFVEVWWWRLFEASTSAEGVEERGSVPSALLKEATFLEVLLGSTIGLIYRSFRFTKTCSQFCSASRFAVEEVIYCIAVWKWRTAIDFRRMLIWQSRGWWMSALCRMWHQCLSKRCVCHMKRMSSMRGIVENSLPLGPFKDFLLPWSTTTALQILWSSGFLLLGQVA